jgi:hypothetical protein
VDIILYGTHCVFRFQLFPFKLVVHLEFENGKCLT